MSLIALRCSLVIYFSIAIQLISHGQVFKENTQPQNWYRGNLHTHSFWSDGNDFPEMIAKWYRDNDYHFLALTDHNILSDHEKWISIDSVIERGGPESIEKLKSTFGDDWIVRRTHKENEQIRLKKLSEFRRKFEQPGRFMMMVGEEISDSVDGLPLHMNATNLKAKIEPAGGPTMVDAINNNLRVAIEQAQKTGEPILVHLNHPNFKWAITAEDLAHVTNERFFEIYNGHPAINHLGNQDRPSVERMWDIANTIRIDQLNAKPLLGLATDDSHDYHGRGTARPGRGWIMVRSDALTPAKILTAIEQGHFYSSSGVCFSTLTVDDEHIEINLPSHEDITYSTQFIGTTRDYNRKTKKAVVIRNEKGEPKRISRVYSDDVGRVLATVIGNSARYKFNGDELYVRAVTTSSATHPDPSFENQKQQAWTQPIQINPRNLK